MIQKFLNSRLLSAVSFMKDNTRSKINDQTVHQTVRAWNRFTDTLICYYHAVKSG